jgi:hypothetical protein
MHIPDRRDLYGAVRSSPTQEGSLLDDAYAFSAGEPAARWMALRMRWYVPQRQMLPLIKSSMSASVGFGFFASSATADMI